MYVCKSIKRTVVRDGFFHIQNYLGWWPRFKSCWLWRNICRIQLSATIDSCWWLYQKIFITQFLYFPLPNRKKVLCVFFWHAKWIKPSHVSTIFDQGKKILSCHMTEWSKHISRYYSFQGTQAIHFTHRLQQSASFTQILYLSYADHVLYYVWGFQKLSCCCPLLPVAGVAKKRPHQYVRNR